MAPGFLLRTWNDSLGQAQARLGSQATSHAFRDCCGLHTLPDTDLSQGPAGPLSLHLRGGEGIPPSATNAGGNTSPSFHWTVISLTHRASQPARQ